MADPRIRQDLTALQADSELRYHNAALRLDELQHVQEIDEWLKEAHHCWETCVDNQKQSGISHAVWNDLEYLLVRVIATIHQDFMKVAKYEFNILGLCGHAYGVEVRPIPNDPDLDSASPPLSQGNTPPLPTVPMAGEVNALPLLTPIRLSPTVPTVGTSVVLPLPSASSSVQSLLMGQLLATLPTSVDMGPSSSTAILPVSGPSVVESLGLGTPRKKLVTAMRTRMTSISLYPLPGKIFRQWHSSSPVKIGPPILAKRSPKKPRRVYGLQRVNAASRPQVLPGPDPTQQDEDSVLLHPSIFDQGPTTSLSAEGAEGVTDTGLQVATGISALFTDDLPPVVSIGVGGGGLGEEVGSTFMAIPGGVDSVGVLQVKSDYGNFVQVNSHLWRKDVAAFVGERPPVLLTAQWSLTQLTIFLLNLIFLDDSQSLNNALQVIETCVSSIASKTQQFLAGLNVLDNADHVLQEIARLWASLVSSDLVDETLDGVGDVLEVIAIPPKMGPKSKPFALCLHGCVIFIAIFEQILVFLVLGESSVSWIT
ncbi:hypothetical protein IW261DRAFT_1428034 [Armillaria novae-zelandiae]|uniref:Uncharacterized protein n=1 Tax=Armillaria novae-zelandiae TaxID=153914 RepID=A0AA39TKW3_9AGAR|nr:hypothetical protein IW261DRAFT_1428034 [Armillaria novae-zelandiae]